MSYVVITFNGNIVCDDRNDGYEIGLLRRGQLLFALPAGTREE